MMITRYGPTATDYDDTYQNWKMFAACGGEDEDVFYEKPYTRALQICGGCDVRSECYDASTPTDRRYGVWGGVAPDGTRVEIPEVPRSLPLDDTSFELVWAEYVKGVPHDTLGALLRREQSRFGTWFRGKLLERLQDAPVGSWKYNHKPHWRPGQGYLISVSRDGSQGCFVVVSGKGQQQRVVRAMAKVSFELWTLPDMPDLLIYDRS